MTRGSTSRSLRRSDRCLTIGSFSIGTLDLAVSLSVLLHAGILGAVLYLGPGPDDRRAQTDFAHGEQAVTVTNLRFLTAAELEEMEHPQPLERSLTIPPPTPPPPEATMLTVREVAVESEPVNLPDKTTPALPDGSRVPPAESHPRPPPPEVKEVKTVGPRPAPAPATTSATPAQGVTQGAAVSDLPVPKYPVLSRRLGEQGLVLLVVSVDSAGRVTEVRVLSDPGYPRLVQAAIAAVKAARFTPAMRNGQPVADVVRVPFRFRLESR